MPKALLTLICALLTIGLFAQQPLEIEDLEKWNRIEAVSINAPGDFSVYVQRPDKGDPTTILYHNFSEQTYVMPATDAPQFSYDGRYLLMMRHPSVEVIRAYKKRDKAKELKGMDSLVVLELSTLKEQVYPGVKTVRTGEKWSDFYTYTTSSALADSLQSGLTKGTDRLVVRRFGSTDSLSIEGVSKFTLARDKAGLLGLQAAHDSLWTDNAFYLDGSFNWQVIMNQKGKYDRPCLSPDGKRAAFLTYLDTLDLKQAPYHLQTWTVGEAAASNRSSDAAEWLPRGVRISEDGELRFSDSGNLLYFGIAKHRPEVDTSMLDEEIPDVEVWTTQDARMYTQENVRLSREKKRTYQTVYRWEQEDFTLLSSPEIAEIVLSETGDESMVLAYDERAYLPRLSWVGGPSYKDVYLIDIQTGASKMIAKEVRGQPRRSPGGQYVYWYSYADTAWFAHQVISGETRQLTDNAAVAFFEERVDVPTEPWAYGLPGWLEDDTGVIIYDRYDWWLFDPSGTQAPRRLTDVRADKKRLRYLQLDPDKKSFSADDRILVSHFDEDTYHHGYAWLNLVNGEVTDILSGPFRLGRRPIKARLNDYFLFTKEDFSTFPDLNFTAVKAETPHLWSPRKISTANPQQKDFSWGEASPYTWIDNQGRELRGMLIKPADFDPTKQYPLLVNFYERSSEGVYSHRAPYPHRSTINYSYYASRGYVIFNPDVIYRVGYPGESAYDCVMSGLTQLLGEGYIDRSRIGVQGHSWGGYQVAHLVTKTDIFACAESGAPVVNMFSAYGGIRWGSGLSRQFQYERTQSRIGGTPWQYPLRYLENSPLFFTDKVNTPVLIMHNDEDGAVPWYQGIEYFAALRRLGKPAWLLNYRGEPHWPLRQANRVDFQRRMSQFFDYYLMEGPLPVWMEEGVGPLRRGIEQGYEAVKED